MKLKPAHQSKRLRKGFTLIELLVVIVIIAALAALIVPNVGMFGRSTDMAVSAKSQSDVANNLQQFFVLQKRYPQGLDSLLDTAGAVYAADTTSGDTQTRGLPYAGADGTRLQAQLAVATYAPISGAASITNPDYFRSLTRAGLDWVYDHDTTVINSNTSNNTFRALTSGVDDPNTVAVESSAAPADIDVAEVTGSYLIGKLAPGGLKPGQRIVAFGYGQKNTSIGKTSTTCPLYPGADKTYYGRYIVYLMVYASGERASLLGVSDAYGRTPDYTEQQFNESLPDGARQG